MEMELKTSGSLPAGVNPQGASKTETMSAKPAEAGKETTPSTASSPASGTPAVPAKDQAGAEAKPGRAAAAAKKAERQAAAKAKEAETKTAQAEEVTVTAKKYEEAIKSGDPDKILAAFGMDDEKLVDLYIAKHGTKEPGEGGGESAAEVKALRDELTKFKEELAAEKVKAEEKRQAETAQATVQGHIDALKTLAAKPEHAEKFEVCNAEPSVIRSLTGGEYSSAANLAFDVMVAVHQKHGEFISYEKALELTENHLVEAHKGLVAGIGKLKKLGGTAPAAKAEDKKPEAAAAGGDPTLEKLRAEFKSRRPRITNSMSVIHPAASTGPKGKAAADQKFRERVLALQQAQKTN